MNFFNLIHQADGSVDISFKIPADVVKKLTDDNWKSLESFIIVLEESTDETYPRLRDGLGAISSAQQITTFLKETKSNNLCISLNENLTAFFDCLIKKIKEDPFLFTPSNVKKMSPSSSSNDFGKQQLQKTMQKINGTISNGNVNNVPSSQNEIMSQLSITNYTEEFGLDKKMRVYKYINESFNIFCKKTNSSVELQAPISIKISRQIMQIIKSALNEDMNLSLNQIPETFLEELIDLLQQVQSKADVSNEEQRPGLITKENILMEFNNCCENCKILKPFATYLCDEFLKIMGKQIEEYIQKRSSGKKFGVETPSTTSTINSSTSPTPTPNGDQAVCQIQTKAGANDNLEGLGISVEDDFGQLMRKSATDSVIPKDLQLFRSGISFIDKYKKVDSSKTKNALVATTVTIDKYKFFKGILKEFDLILDTLYQKISKPKNNGNNGNNCKSQGSSNSLQQQIYQVDSEGSLQKKMQTQQTNTSVSLPPLQSGDKFKLPSKTSVGKNKIRLYCLIALINALETYKNVSVNTLINTFVVVFNTLPGHMIFSNAMTVLDRYESLLKQELDTGIAIQCLPQNSQPNSINISLTTSNSLASMTENYQNIMNPGMTNVSGISSINGSANIVGNGMDLGKFMVTPISESLQEQQFQSMSFIPRLSSSNGPQSAINSVIPMNINKHTSQILTQQGYQQNIGGGVMSNSNDIFYQTSAGSQNLYGNNIMMNSMPQMTPMAINIPISVEIFIQTTSKYSKYILNQPTSFTNQQIYSVIINILQNIYTYYQGFCQSTFFGVLIFKQISYLQNKVSEYVPQMAGTKNEIMTILYENEFYYQDSAVKNLFEHINNIIIYDAQPINFIIAIRQLLN